MSTLIVTCIADLADMHFSHANQVLLGESSSEQRSVVDLISRVRDELASNSVELDERRDIQVMQIHLQKDDPDYINEVSCLLQALTPTTKLSHLYGCLQA